MLLHLDDSEDIILHSGIISWHRARETDLKLNEKQLEVDQILSDHTFVLTEAAALTMTKYKCCKYF